MKLFSTFNQFFVFLVLIAYQNAIAVPLTKAEAENGRLMNGDIRRITTHLRQNPNGAEILLKSIAVMITELERLGTKDSESSFAKDAQKWREIIGKLDPLSRKKGMEEPVKEPQIDSEKIAAAKIEVDKLLGAIKNPESVKGFSIEKQKEFIGVSEENVIKAATQELKLLDTPQLKKRAEEIKKKNKEAILEHKTKNRNVLKQQLGWSVDVSKEVKSFNDQVDSVVGGIIQEQIKLKKQQPGGLSLEDIVEEFNQFIIDQRKFGKERSLVGTKPITKDEKEDVDRRLFEILTSLSKALEGRSYQKIKEIFDHVKSKCMDMIDAQFNKPDPLIGWLLPDKDQDREDVVNKKLDEMFALLLQAAQVKENKEEPVVIQEETVVEPVIEQKEVKLPLLPATLPKRPQLDKASIIKPSQPKKEEQKQIPVQSVQHEAAEQPEQQQKELSNKEKFEEMKDSFNKFIEDMIQATKEKNEGATGSVSGEEQESYDAVAIGKARNIVKFLGSHSDIEDVDAVVKWISTEYEKAIDDQVTANQNYVRLHGDNSRARKSNFSEKLDGVMKFVKREHEEIAQ